VETLAAVYIISWTLFQTLVGAVIGKSKGRLDAGVFWSFLLGPIGWLIGDGNRDAGTETGTRLVLASIHRSGRRTETLDKLIASRFPSDARTLANSHGVDAET